MSKLIIMQGLPASGKSTKAKELMAHGNTVRINKDLLRTMLHFDKWNGRNEGLTREASRALAMWYLSKDVNVIIDDTNLSPSTIESWKAVAKGCDAKIEYVRMNTHYLDCIQRDMGREKAVGAVVIKNMALQYDLVPKPRKGYVLCDIDGTIADIKHRLHFVKTTELMELNGEKVVAAIPSAKKDWKSFFASISEDSVREATRSMLIDLYNQGCDIVFVTARPGDYKAATLDWLKKHNLDFAFTLIMRKSNDKRPDTEVKKDMLDTYFKDRSQIYKVIDDRPSVIRMWREQGLDVIDVGSGVEF